MMSKYDNMPRTEKAQGTELYLQTGICPRVGTTDCRSVGQNAGFLNDLGQWFSTHASENPGGILRGASGLPKKTRG